MNRRELLFGVAAVAIAPALPTITPESYWTLAERVTATGRMVLRHVISESPDTKWLAANDDFAMAA